MLRELSPIRKTRSIEILGTAWKWIAGTPDHEDFQMISDRVNGLLENNHKQIIINRALELRVNEITKMTNTILNNIGSSDALKIVITKNIEKKLKIMKEELTNINYSIQWAKSGIINSFIFSGYELNITKNLFENQNFPYANLIEALEFGEVKISMNQTTQINVVNLPKTEKETCRKLFIKPVKRKEMTIKLNNENFVICKNSVIEIKMPCKMIYDISVCGNENLVNVTSSKCLPNLLSGIASSCPTSNDQHIATITEISPGLMMLNGYNGPIEVDRKNLWLNGTYLIKYHNATVQIENRTYYNNEITVLQPLPAILKTTNSIANYEEMLSLEMLKDLHINNAAEIQQFINNYRTTLTTSVVIPSAIGLVLLLFLFRKWIEKKESYEVPVKLNDDNSPGVIASIDTYPSNEDVGI